MDDEAVGGHVYPPHIDQGLDDLAHVEVRALPAAIQIPAQDIQVCIGYQAVLIGVLHTPKPKEIQYSEGLELRASYRLIQAAELRPVHFLVDAYPCHPITYLLAGGLCIHPVLNGLLSRSFRMVVAAGIAVAALQDLHNSRHDL